MTGSNRIIPVFIPHLGCPHDCVFCDQKRISGSLLPASPGDVVRALEKGLAVSGERAELAFYGGSFTAIPAEAQAALLGAAGPYLRDGRLDAIRISTRPDAVDGGILDRLRGRGVKTVELGAQSMDDGVLVASGRGHRASDTVGAAKLVKAAGFRLILQMMTGLPGSDPERDLDTAHKLAALSPDGVRIYPTVVIRGTPLFGMWQKGAYRAHTVEDAVAVCARIVPVFEDAGIPIIRLGLNPTDGLTAGAAAAGAYHPALGELVLSRIFLERAAALLEKEKPAPGAVVTLGVNPRRVSVMAGQRGENKKALAARFGLRGVKIAPADLSPREISLL